MLFRVVWEIDIEAGSPREAAEQARKCQEPGTEALYFSTFSKELGQVDVDLMESGEVVTSIYMGNRDGKI